MKLAPDCIWTMSDRWPTVVPAGAEKSVQYEATGWATKPPAPVAQFHVQLSWWDATEYQPVRGTSWLVAIIALVHEAIEYVHEYVCVMTISTGVPVAEEFNGCQLIVPPRKWVASTTRLSTKRRNSFQHILNPITKRNDDDECAFMDKIQSLIRNWFLVERGTDPIIRMAQSITFQAVRWPQSELSVDVEKVFQRHLSSSNEVSTYNAWNQSKMKPRKPFHYRLDSIEIDERNYSIIVSPTMTPGQYWSLFRYHWKALVQSAGSAVRWKHYPYWSSSPTKFASCIYRASDIEDDEKHEAIEIFVFDLISMKEEQKAAQKVFQI